MTSLIHLDICDSVLCTFLADTNISACLDYITIWLIYLQALCVSGTTVSRQVNGVPASRADMIISVSFLFLFCFTLTLLLFSDHIFRILTEYLANLLHLFQVLIKQAGLKLQENVISNYSFQKHSSSSYGAVAEISLI